ncbi:small integral membrane protein 4 [Ooceraea biroi]|nr:small integral membrane protein 4 [Ooceraea biroi]
MTFKKQLRRIIKNWPGRRIFGEYSFLPVFFVLGAALEFSMIHWHVGEVNFYKIYKRRRIEELVQERLQREA